jgi:hypothetical protein
MTAPDLHAALTEILRRGQDIIDGKRLVGGARARRGILRSWSGRQRTWGGTARARAGCSSDAGTGGGVDAAGAEEETRREDLFMTILAAAECEKLGKLQPCWVVISPAR